MIHKSVVDRANIEQDTTIQNLKIDLEMLWPRAGFPDTFEYCISFNIGPINIKLQIL